MKTANKLMSLLGLIVVASMVLTACAPATEAPTAVPAQPTAAPAQPTAAPAQPTAAPAATFPVGIVLPTKDEPRWIQDQTRFQDAFKKEGFNVQILFSQGDSAKEKANVEALISQGIKVLIICPQDASAAAAAADEAHAAGVKVISYDRLIRDTASVDYYVTFDSMAVGAAWSDYLISKAGSTKGNNLYLYAGAASDNNAFIFFEGAWEKIQPKIADGTFVIKNSSEAVALQAKPTLTRDEEAKIIGQVTTNWDFNTAKNIAELNLTAAKTEDKGTVFIVAPNDGTARAIADAFAADKDVKTYYVSGQDAEKASVQYIIDGKQSMTVLKDVRTLVADAIAAAVAYLKGGTPEKTNSYNNGKVDVPAKPSAIVTVTKDNVQAALIDSGYYQASDFTGLGAAAAAPTAAPAGGFTGLKYEAPDCKYGGNFKSMEAVDANTVKFTFCNPDPAFPSKAAFGNFSIQDQATLDKTGGDSAKLSDPANINGTGPYIVKEWVKGDHITFEANPNYWGPAPKTKTVIFKWSKEAAQRLLELQSGTVDAIFTLATEDYATVQKDTNLKFYPYPGLNVFYLGMNNTIKPFDNEKVRQAIAMGIDKKRLVDNFYPGGSAVAEQFAPPTLLPGFSTTGDGAKWYTYDPAAAKKLLADAGFPNGFETTLSYREAVRVYLPLPPKVAEDLQAQLADIGVKVTINVEESGAFLQSVADGKEGMFMLGWGADYPDATDFYDFHFTGASKNFGTPYPDLVDAIRKAASLSDPAERQKGYDTVNTLVKQHVPMVPIAHGAFADAAKANLNGFNAGPLSNENFYVMSNGTDQIVWMQSAEPISLFCNDETDGETFAACLQTFESLLSFKIDGVEVQPGLAEKYEANADLTEWTFHLRQGVKFQNGDPLTANDVVATWDMMWDTKNPNHKGNTGVFEYFKGFFGGFLNPPPK